MGQSTPAGPLDILLVEDNEGDAFLIQEMLEKAAPDGFSIAHAPTLEQAEPQYRQHEFNILLLDLNLPGLSGLDAVEKVRADLPSTPIIVMTGMDDEKRALGIMQRGAQDYIVKGQYGNNILPRVIRYAIERKQFENRVIELVHFDRVTGLINRDAFHERLDGALALAAQNHLPLAVLLLSLRRFKEVTATLGHAVGNALLKAVAVRLKECLMRQDSLARLEGAEFMLLMTGPLAAPERLAGFCEQLVAAMERPFEIGEHSVQVGCSIGIASYPDCGRQGAELIRHADIALHRARQHYRNEFQFYTLKLNEELSGRITLEKELHLAVRRGELAAHYQPIVDLKSGRVSGVETLLRWHHPEKGMIPPAVFIPIAEQSELILEIGNYILREACRQFMAWEKLVPPDFYMAVNLSTRDFQQADFVTYLKNVLAQAGMDPQRLALEITESTLMDDPDRAIGTIGQCRDYGASVFVDDFGTGYSSLSYLSRLPLDLLKIDRSFVSDITSNGTNLLIATATINLAHGLGFQVVAEGIETKEQKDLLRILGCDKAQGYYFSRPLPPDAMTQWLNQCERAA